MMIYVLIFLVVILLVTLVFVALRDRRLRRRRSVESIGRDLWDEIGEERETAVERGKKFRRILEEKKRE